MKEQKGDALHVRLIGAIQENTSLEQLIGNPPAQLIVNCKEISRINSVGVKSWIKYFQTCQSKNVKITFIECSTIIVEQMNLISNFTAGGVVESVYVPFICTSCKNEMVGLFKTEEIKKLKFVLPKVKCPKCENPAEFDDIPEEYFTFLMR